MGFNSLARGSGLRVELAADKRLDAATHPRHDSSAITT